MGNENTKKSISAKQMAYAVGIFIIASNLLTKYTYIYAKNEAWLSILIATAASLILVSIYGKLFKIYPGRSFFEINESVFGVAGGKIISALYLFYFLSLTVFNTRDFGEFVHSAVLPTTPLNVTYSAFMIVCAYAVRKGADKMTQYGAFIFYIYFVLLLFIAGLLIPTMHPSNFLPAFTVPLNKILLGSHLVAMLPFGEIIVFVMMGQYMLKPEETGSALRRGLIIGASVTMFLVLRVIAVLGNYSMISSSPTFNLIRLINIGDILTRLEIINAVLQMILLFFKTAILLFTTVTGIGYLFNIRKFNVFTFVISVLVIICANVFFRSSGEHVSWFKAAPAYATLFVFVIPLLTLVVLEIKKIATNESKKDTLQP